MADTKTYVDEHGNTVIAASRRPDGTWRKERRVRDGYVPQDEQPVYQPRQVAQKAKGPIIPGMDMSAVPAGKQLSKSAKKNAKRKEKKAEEGPAAQSQPLPPATKATLATRATAVAPAASAPAAPVDAAPNSEAVVVSKLIQKTRKKLKQCEALVARRDAGDKLTQEEEEKLDKLPAWQEEVRALEAELAQLNVNAS